MSSQINESNLETSPTESLTAERDEALREQGKLLVQIEALHQKLQRAEWYQQHVRLGWVWMSLLLLFGVSGYWRGYMNLAPPQSSAANTPPSIEVGKAPTTQTPTSQTPTTQTPTSPAPITQPPSTQEPPTPSPAKTRQPPSNFPPSASNPTTQCPEGFRYRCLRLCTQRNAKKRCVERATQPTCKCWKQRKKAVIRVLDVTGEGPISLQRLNKATKQRLPFFHRCYRRLRHIRPAPPQGEILLRYLIPSFGRPQKIEVVSSTLQHIPLQNCLIRQLQRLRFRPAVDSTPTRVSLRLGLRFQLPPTLPTQPTYNRRDSQKSQEKHPRQPNLPNEASAKTCPAGKLWRCAKPCYQYDEKGVCLAPGTRIKCRCMRPNQRP